MRVLVSFVAPLLAAFIWAAPAFAASWSVGPELPTPRSEIGAAEAGGQIYVLGGGVGAARQMNEIYDPSTGAWRRGARCLAALTILASRATTDGSMSSVVRKTTRGRQMPPGSTTHPPIAGGCSRSPTPRSSPGVAVLGGQIYVVGGIVVTRDTPVVEVFDPATRRLDPAHQSRSRGTISSWRRMAAALYAIGGRIVTSARNIDTVEILDPTAGAWTFGAPMLAPRSGIAGATLDGRVYVFGGEDPGQAHDDVSVYDPASDSWSAAPAMPTPRHGLGVVAYGGQLHVLGGEPRPAAAPTRRSTTS